ncbi:MAG: glycosyltransferase family 39 protein [Chthoniobacterales bacterium]
MTRLRLSLLVLCIWAAIYLPRLGALEIKGEEGRRILPAVTMLKSGNYLVPQVGSEPYFRKPPLINWLVAASFKITGRRDEWSARIPSALAVLAVALAFVCVARGALGSTGALIAALAWLTNFGLLEKGRLIEIEALYASLSALAFICWLSWWREGRSPWLVWTVPWIFLGLGLLAKGPLHLFFFYAVLLAVLISTRTLRSVLHPAHLLGVLIMLGIFAAWAVPCLLAMRETHVAHAWTREFSGRVSGEDFHFAGWILNIPRGLGYFLPWLLLFGFRGKSGDDKEPATQTFRGVAWGVVISFVVISLLPGSLPRYTMPLLAPASWLLASALTTSRIEFPSWLRLRRPPFLAFELRWPSLITATVVAAMLVYSCALVPRLRTREKVRNLATAINEALPAAEPLYAVDPDYQPFLFYVREPLVYCSQLAEVPLTARFFLVRPEKENEALASARWAPRHVQKSLSLRDYRKKGVILFEIL